jgi:AcrR family transcriptional regulator
MMVLLIAWMRSERQCILQRIDIIPGFTRMSPELQNGYVYLMTRRDTRARILDAVLALHEEVGPADTTVTAVAERAGVQRLTVYRHFPDERALIQGCSAHWSERHPPPDPGIWSGIRDPRRRLARALGEIYRFYEGGADMMDRVLRDEERVPALKEVMGGWWAYLSEVAGGLSAGWGLVGGVRGRRMQALVRAAVGHALGFPTWRSLRDEGLTSEEAATMMTSLVVEVAEGRGGG